MKRFVVTKQYVFLVPWIFNTPNTNQWTTRVDCFYGNIVLMYDIISVLWRITQIRGQQKYKKFFQAYYLRLNSWIKTVCIEREKVWNKVSYFSKFKVLKLVLWFDISSKINFVARSNLKELLFYVLHFSIGQLIMYRSRFRTFYLLNSLYSIRAVFLNHRHLEVLLPELELFFWNFNID